MDDSHSNFSSQKSMETENLWKYRFKNNDNITSGYSSSNGNSSSWITCGSHNSAGSSENNIFVPRYEDEVAFQCEMLKRALEICRQKCIQGYNESSNQKSNNIKNQAFQNNNLNQEQPEQPELIAASYPLWSDIFTIKSSHGDNSNGKFDKNPFEQVKTPKDVSETRFHPRDVNVAPMDGMNEVYFPHRNLDATKQLDSNPRKDGIDDDTDVPKGIYNIKRPTGTPKKTYMCNICKEYGKHFIYDCPLKASARNSGITSYQGPKVCFGIYKCTKCKRVWYSVKSGADVPQSCKKCNFFVFPEKQMDLAVLNGKAKEIIKGPLDVYQPNDEYSLKDFKVIMHVYRKFIAEKPLPQRF